MSYPHPSWQPGPTMIPPHMHGAEYAYGPAAAKPRAYAAQGAPPGYVYFPNPYAHAAQRQAQAQEPPKDDYWATELKDNPLGLENMVRAEEYNDSKDISASRARMPASTSVSRASDAALRNSYPPKSSAKASLAVSAPNTRAPSPSRPRRRESGGHTEAPPSAYPYPVEQEAPAQAPNNNVAHASHHRPPSRSYGGRTSVPAEPTERYSSASAAAAQMTATASRAQTLPAHRRHASAAPTTMQAQGMQRARTLPGDTLATGTKHASPIPRRLSERYDYRRPGGEDESEEEPEGDEEEPEDEDYIYPITSRLARGEGESERELARRKPPTETQPKEKGSKIDRVRAWVGGVRNATTRSSDRDRDHESPSKSRDKSRSKSRRTSGADEFGDEQNYDHPQHYEHSVEYVRPKSGGILKNPIAPESVLLTTTEPLVAVNTGFSSLGMKEISEEPEDMRNYYQRQSRGHAHQSPRQHQQQQQQYSERRGSEHERHPRQRHYREEELSETESSSSSSDEDYGRPIGRQASLREKERKLSQNHTPYHTSTQRPVERTDSLRVDDNAGAVQAHLPSPRSLRQSSSRPPSARPSYEQVRAERERDIPKSPNGHLTTGQSSASAAAAGMYVYGTPPITPTRQEHPHRDRIDGGRSPYTSQTAVPAIAEPTPGFQTPARLQYLYRGGSASPSPAGHRPSSTQPQVQAQIYTQTQPQSQQYSSYVAAEPTSMERRRAKKQSPRASRSPSPLPPGTSSASAYYAATSAATTPARAPSRSHSRSQGHSTGRSHNSHNNHSHTASQPVTQALVHDGRRRSSSRAGGAAPAGYSSASGAAAAAASSSRHVRAGFWNRRGDHLTQSGHVVYCPQGRNFPPDLAEYPDGAFQDQFGRKVKDPIDAYPELPESIPHGGRAAEKSYDSFIKYVLLANSKNKQEGRS